MDIDQIQPIAETDIVADARPIINALITTAQARSQKHAQALIGVTGTVVITHNLGTEDVLAQVFDSAKRLTITDVQITGPNTLTVTFEAPFTGRIVVRS